MVCVSHHGSSVAVNCLRGRSFDHHWSSLVYDNAQGQSLPLSEIAEPVCANVQAALATRLGSG